MATIVYIMCHSCQFCAPNRLKDKERLQIVPDLSEERSGTTNSQRSFILGQEGEYSPTVPDCPASSQAITSDSGSTCSGEVAALTRSGSKCAQQSPPNSKIQNGTFRPFFHSNRQVSVSYLVTLRGFLWPICGFRLGFWRTLLELFSGSSA